IQDLYFTLKFILQHTPPSVISDLYTDIQQGHMLLDLLEVLSGQHLPREKGFNTFQCRSNIENALTFLRSKSLKLINIHVADIIEGKPSIVLGLIWTIIFHFHIEELARTLACTYNQPSLDCSSTVDSSPKASRSAKKSAKIKERWKISATKALLLWAKDQCSLHGSISVTDFKSSWRSGLPFLAIINALRPGLVDLEKAKARSNRENLDEAFRIAELELNIPRLLEPEDIDITNPDEKSIMTYVAQFLQYSRNMPETEDMQGKLTEAVSWLAAQGKKLAKLLMDTENETHYHKYKINEWKAELDQMLPPPLDGIEAWLQEVEHLQAEDLPDLQDPFKAMSLFREIIVTFKGLMDCFDSHLDTLQSFENKDEKNMPLVVPEKLEEMKRRLNNTCFTNSNTLLEYHYGLCSAIANEVMLKLNIWDIKYGTKESVESLLENWNNFVEEKRLETQLETATHICEDLKNKSISSPEITKLFKMVESKISMCRDYIANVNSTLQKVLSSWSNYTENLHSLKTWLDEKRNEHPKEIPAEILASWNSVHGSLNEAGNYLIEVSKEQVGSNIAKELKKLNRRWAKFVKRTHFVSHQFHTTLSTSNTVEKTRELPGSVEKIEELLRGVDGWTEEVGCLLGEIGHKALAARGTSYQEQVAAAEEILQSLMQNGSDQASQQHSHTTGLQSRVKEVNRLHLVLFIFLYGAFLQEAFNALDNKVLDRFLKAAEQLKNISSDQEKLVVEEKSKDVRNRWEAVHHEIMSCVQLMIEREKKKFNTTLKKINKQLGKEKKFLSMDKTKGLLKEHEVPDPLLFYSPTSLSECIVSPSCSCFLNIQCCSLCLWKFLLFVFLYVSCRTNSLRTALEIVLPIENESILLRELDQRLNKKDIQQFNLMNSDLAYRELKELQRSILNQIEVCKQLENPDSSARDEFNPIDLQAASKIMFYYQNQLEEMSHKMQIRETVLKDLEAFMASLRKIQSSIRCLTDSSGQPEIQEKALREAAQEVSHMAKEAKCLDERLKAVDICLEDADCGGETWCEKLVLNLSEELTMTCGHSSDQMLTEENDLYKIFSTRNCELLKNIQDLCDRINKIGLKDPTIPAIQQRVKSLTELEKELDCAAVEMKSVREITNKLLQMKEEKAEEANEQCRVTERLWEDTKLLLAECQEQCARALELLKQYQSCKSSLTSIIQKLEIVLAQQNSYMGKENLNRLITKIEEAKEEFHDHSEDVDKINQICKNLQFQLNKMRSFEEPPFENEANIIVDRWLDINEKTENYCDNLGRAQALWDKLLNLSGTIDAWANAELKNIEDHSLTEEDLTQLKACLRVQEQKLQKFDNTVAEIEELLNSNEPPLELQVIRSSVVQKMELIKDLLSMKRHTSELAVNTAELKGDLDLAKTQIGMTESLLKALSPSDTLEIFTKLEEIHQKILQQKHHVTLLQEETDCPDVDELNKQLKCVTDLFNKKKDVFQDHFIGVLNRQCKNFNDWFSSTQLSLKDCFEPSETKQVLEERQQRLKHFLTSDGKDRDIQEVKTLLNKVKHYLPKASINQLNSRVRDQEAELQRLISKCQKQEKELGASLQQLSSLEESSIVLEEWLITQEEKLQEIEKDETKLEDLYKTLLMQREEFDSLGQLANSLKEAGLTEDGTILETNGLISRYHTLVTNVSEMAGNSQGLAVEGQHFEEIAQDMSSWIKRLEKAVNNLRSQESELPPDERNNQIKEITALKNAGDVKIQSMVALGETLMRNEKIKKPEVQQTISELKNQWESTCQLATEYRSPQEQLQLTREQYEQSKESLRLALNELKKEQEEMGFALQPALQEKQAQLTSYAHLLQKAEDLTSQFNELESQDHLQSCTENPYLTEESWLELKHQHENLLSQLQTTVQTLERHVQEHQQFQDMVTGLSTELKTLSEKLTCFNKMFSSCLKEQQAPLSRFEDKLKKILVLAEAVKQSTSSPGQKFIKDEIETLQSEHRSLVERLENVKQKEENIFNEALELKDELADEIQMEDKTDTMLEREIQVTSDTPVATEESFTTVEFKECLEMHNVSIVLTVMTEEQKVNELKNEVAELDIVLINEQLKELENLQAELETWKAKSLSKEACPSATGSNSAELQSPEPVVPCWDRLLQELDAVKAVKQQQCSLVNEYQKNLSAAQSSMKNLSTEKDNIKMGPMNNTVLLEKIKACVQALHKERDVLNQLKAQQESLSQHLTCMDKVLTASQMRQLEQWWQHMEQTVQKKHDQVVAEINEFNLLMNKAQDIQRLIQEQYLQTELHSSAGEKVNYPVVWTTELQDIKHGLSLLKRRIELQMKRIWSDQEKMALENCIHDLQSKLETLSEQRMPQEDVQITGPALKKQEMMNKLKENISWVKDSLSSLDQKAALFPSDVKSQIRNCELMRTEVLDREPVIESLDKELQHIIPSLKPEEISDMTFLLQALQNSYKALVLKSVQRLQHLELQLEERQRLIAEIEKVHCQLRNAETLARLDMNQTSTWSELADQQAILKEILKDIQEIDGLISSHCKESQVTAGELSLSEQLFLIDQLRSLKNRARKTQRQIQNKCHEVGKKIAVYREFAEGITSLQQDLNDLQCGEVNLEDKLLGATQEVKNKCKALKEKVLCFQSNLSQMMKYKEVFECIGLNWDSQQLDELHELQTQFLKIKNKIKGKLIHFDNVVREWDNLHSLLNEIWSMTSTVRKEASKLNDSSSSSPAENLVSAQILLQTVQLILYLTQEVENQINKNEVFDIPFKESKRQEIQSLEKDVEELIQLLQNLISSLQCVNKEDIQNEVEHIFHAIKHIQLELQQPLLVDMKMMQFEKMRWEAIQNMMTAEFSAIKYLMEKERENEEEKSLAADIETKLKTLQDHELQLKTDIAARVSALQDACKTGELYTEAVKKAAKFLEDYEAQVYSATAELGTSDEACQTPQWKQEGFDSAVADIEKLSSKLKNLVKPEDKINLENTLRELVNKSLALREKVRRKEADERRYFEKYKRYTESKDKVRDDLNKLEKMLMQSLSQIPMSYKEALENLEESKILVSNIDSAEDDLVKLRQVSGELMRLRKGSDRALGRTVTALWENWLGLLEAAKELEINCEELKQEWKFINEELERETIILDKLQEEQPESLKEKEKATREELVELLDFVNSFEENINRQQLLLLLLLHRIKNILNTSENTEAEAVLPALCEIKTMQDRCKKLYEKTQDHKDLVQSEIQERNKISEEINAVKNALQNAASMLDQDAVTHQEKHKKNSNIFGEGVHRNKQIFVISTIVFSLLRQVSFEILQSSPQYVLKRKAETINNGLQAIEKMLQQKSENIAKAKEVQKQIWDMLDLWHYKLNELDAEVHDIVEQDSCHAQELMDILVTPLQQYQQVSQLAERRTAILNKAASKMEEYDELLKNMKVWIENTNCLLREDAQNDSAKSLHKYSDDLQMALEDSEQKQNLLHNVYLELEELTPVFETDSIMQQLNEADDQVETLQHEIAEILPQIQHVADELSAIESHVKVFEKDIVKMKTILSSEDLLEFSPKDQLKHGQVILDHVGPMQKTIVHIQSYEEALQLPGVKTQPFSVFQKARQLLRELKKIEKITKEKNELLEVIVLYPLILLPFIYFEAGEMEAVKEEIIKLCQRKEDILTGMKNSMSELHQCLQQEVPDLGDESPAFVFAQTDSIGTNVSDQQVNNCVFSCALLQTDTPPVLNATQCSPGKTGDSEEEVDGGRPEPETILQVCQAQVAELEQWLDKTKVSLGSDPQTPKMQQMVELQLGDCQVMLSEIEQKVLSLLEDCGNSAGHQQETEALSLKLKEVKCNLEKVQMMLQDKYNEEQVKQMNAMQSKNKSHVHTIDFTVHSVLCSQDLKVKAAEQKSLIDFIESCVEKMQLQFEDSVTQKLERSNGESDLKSKQADPTLSAKDQTGNKWQYLQQELSSKMKSPLYQLVEPQITTKLNMLPRGMFASAGTPTVEELKTYTVQLGDISQEANVVHAQDNVAEEVSSNLDRKLFELLLAISRCLNNMEEMLNTSVLSTEEAAVQQVLYETLSIELQKLHADLSDKKDDLLKSITCAGGSTDVFCECFSNLQARLEQTQAATASRSNSMKAGLDHNSNYQNEVRLLYDQLTEKKATLQQCLNAICGHNVSEQLQKTDVCALELQNFENQVAKLRGYGERFQLPITLIQEVYKLEDVLDDMWRILKAKYVELNSPSISENQYEDLLHGFAELVAIGQEKVAQDAKQLTKSRAALQSHLESHKDFFHNLMTHMAFMQAFSEKVSPSILQKREKFWRELVNEVRLLEQKASQYGICLESLLKEWTEFDDECLAFSKELEAVNSTLPSVNLVEETEERLMERIALLQQIKSSVDGKHARLYQMVKEGKKLLTAVSCPEITSQIRKLEEQWLSLTKKIGNELHRLQTLLQLLVSYNRDSEELMKWLDSAQQRMNFWKEQSLSVSQDLPTIRDNINSLFTFSKEVDEKSSLKSSVVSTANQLFHVKQADTAALRSSLAKFEQKWGELITQLPAIQEKLHQLQMEKLSSREAIAELMTWLDHVEQQKGHEEPVNSQSSAAHVRSLLQKYKEYMMEMNFKQWMVDFVNQSLLQMSTCDVESKRYERTEFAECLGEMNLRWHGLQASLSRKIQDLEQLLENITENENKAQTLHNWLEAQSDRLRSLQTPESLISAQNTLDDCKDLENQLASKSKMLNELKQTVALNGSAEQTPEAAPFRIAELCEMRDNVVSQVAQLKTSMQSILEQWRVYDEIYAEVSLMMTRYLYCIDQCKPSVLSLEALKKQVKTLQSLQDELENSEESWAKFQAAASNLKKNCSPTFAEIIDQKCTEANTRWSSVNEDITDQLRTAKAILQLWEPFDILCTEAAAKLQQHEEQCTQFLDAHMPEDNLVETLKQRIQDIKNLQHGLQNIVGCRSQISELADQIKQQAGTAAQAVLLEKLQPLQRASYLEKMLQRKLDEFEVFILIAINLPFYFQNHTLELAALSPSIESLNEASIKLPLSDFTLKKMQSLTRQWSQKTATALELCSVHEGTQNDEKKFLQKCENWINFLEKMKEALKTNIPGRFEELQEQQRVYEMLQTEISINQQTFNSIIAKVLLFLESGGAEKRTEFISKLTLLKEQWQNVIRLVQQRKKDIDGLVSQWQIFRSSLQSLSRFLDDTNSFLLAVKSQDCYSLYHLRNLIHDFKSKAVILQRWQGMYSSVIDVGEKLRIDSDPETSAVIQEGLSQLQQNWGDTQVQLENMKMKLSSVLWNCCEKQTKELESRLRELKDEVKDPLPVENEELYKAKEHMKELEQSLADWAHNMKELRAMKVELAHCILTEDMMVLKEQVEHLHRQWEELCLRVSLRKQEIEDRLNAWIVFNEKNKELCSWLVQMESKVLQTADVSIEDMIDKLQKDCMEEINLFSENKLHLKQMGDQLIKASNKTRVAEIDDKLNKINDRWQHLFDVIGARVKKLKETFAFIQLLDKNMSNLRTWLARIESELSKPVVYDICDDQEIQKRLAEQQDLQRDIEQHTAGVESVFNICEVLLHDSDACANETECDSIQQTSRSLDRRWRNICAMSMERRMKIEETWRLWQRFLDDYSRFEDWLKSAERTAASPNSSEVLYTHAKEELKKFEAFQRQVHERLTQLELINKQYRRLARENRTDSASKLKQMVHEGNQRWDNLQKRVAAILRRLKHFTNRRDEFEATRENILVWLTEMDLQLTNVEHFSKSNFDDKMRQLNGFQQEITLHTNKIDQLIVFGEQLIQKSEPLDATLIEDELEELHRYCQEVFGRVARFHQRLTSRHPGLDDEKETSENETDPEDSREIQNDLWHKKAIGDGPSSPQSLCHLMPPTQGHERSGCETPVSVDSIPLEWDHTGDVGGSSSHEDEEEATYYSALSGKSVSEAHPWHSPDSPVCRKHRYNQAEMVGNVLSSPETSTPYKPGYLGEGEVVRCMQTWPLLLVAWETSESICSLTRKASRKQFSMWELIQAQDLRNKLRMKQNLQQWQQLNSDLSDVSTWLDKTEEELEELQKAKPPTSMHEMEQRVKKLKDMLKAFDNYKAVVLSVNLSSKEFQKAESTEFKELQNRLRKVNLRWEKATHALNKWRKGLQQALLHCQEFHDQSQKLVLWLASADSRRNEAQITDPNADPHTILECQKELMQLEKELLEQQPKVNSLQELCSYLLLKSDGEDYIEAEEKVHVIGTKLKQLIEQVSHDLKTIQGNLVSQNDLDSGSYHPVTVKASPPVKKATESHPQPTKVVPRSPSFFYRVLRAALPLQLFFLLLLLLACMIPSSEEDYSCTQANNFARSFYPMLRYTNGPPPT
uniref:Spectrin repeat containing nuclear envelope protein 2 n=1 Tax=Cairina moschata TaxID=8855 RepID=A0A8C3BV29_CAIMO